MPIVTLIDVHKSFGPDIVFDQLCQRFYPKEKVGLIGPNGSGKTTLFKLILGDIEPDVGRTVRRKGLRIAYLPQEPIFDGRYTLLEEMHAGFEPILNIQKKMQALAEQFADLTGASLQRQMSQYDKLAREFDLAGGYAYETRTNTILAGVGFDETLHNTKISALSGGQLSRLGLAKALLMESDLLLLDEPTNHLDLQGTIWLEKFLKSYDGAAIIISHDRYLLDNLVCKIIEIENNKSTTWKGTYSNYAATKKIARLQQQREHERRTKMVAKTRDFIARNKDQEGMRKTARGRKKRLDALLAKQPDFLAKPTDGKKTSFAFAKAKGRSDLVIRADSLSKSFGDITLFTELTFDLLSGERLGITGPNGTGKSTLLKMALGQVPPTAGSIKMGKNLKLGYLDQHSRTLDPTNTVLEEVRVGRPDLSETALRSKLGAFLFCGDDVFKTTGQLSGGQQNRLILCKLVLTEPDVLVLDEPTNHLDIAAKEMLEEALATYNGTIIVVSHDRFFLNRMVGRLLAIGVDEFGQKKIGRCELVDGGAGIYSRYVKLTEDRRTEYLAGSDSKTAGKKLKRPRLAKKKSANSIPKELRQFNKVATEQLEEKIIEIEDQIADLREKFGDETIYKDPAILTQTQQKFDAKQAELGLLYRAYELREG